MKSATPGQGFGIGASLLRKEDARHLRGRGQFVSDIRMPGLAEVVFLRSPHAHARIRSIAVPPEARGRIFTASDLPRMQPIRIVSHAIGAKSPAWPPLATDKVRYVGEAIAACVAPTHAEAEDLAASIVVDFETLDAVVDAPAALNPGGALVHDHWGDNLYIERTISGGDIEAAARDAAITVKREYRMNRQSGSPMEGRAVLAYRDHRLDEVVVYTSTQTPHTVRVALAETLGIEERRLRVVAPDVGGGFGPKARLYPEEVILAALALELDHPVRWVEDRNEHLLTGAHCRDHHYKLTAYADREGRILGIDTQIIVDAGAYGLWPQGPYQEANMAARTLPGPYTIANYRARTFTVATNKAPIGPYRGVGRPGACFAIERTIDEVARALGRDPVEVRIANMIPPGQMPFASVTGMHYDTGDYAASVRLCAKLLDSATIRERQRRGEADGRLVGIGFASLDRTWRRGIRLARRLDHPRLRELHRAAAVGRQSGADGRHPIAWPGSRNDLVADRLSGARDQPGAHLGPSRRYRDVGIRLRHLRLAQHGHVGRRGGARQPRAARQRSPASARICCNARSARRAAPTGWCSARTAR
jgi:aerobic carbon-monoxide dehydrogenase large subunit